MSSGIRIAVIGDEYSVREMMGCMKFPDCVDSYVWTNSLFYTVEADFLEHYDLYVVGFRFRDDTVQLMDTISRFAPQGDNVILDYYRIKHALAPVPKVIQKMQTVGDGEIDGIVLGISHAEVGIIEQRLPGYFLNLAVSSQDLFSDFKTLEFLYQNHYEKIKNLKTVIIDLFDYSYFNYDVSMGSKFVDYLCSGGMDFDEHHYENGVDKRKWECSFEELLEKIKSARGAEVSPEKIQLWNVIGEIPSFDIYEDEVIGTVPQVRRGRVLENPDRVKYVPGKYTKQVYQDTIDENISVMKRLLELVKTINPEAKTYGVILPRYCGVNKDESEIVERWKKLFYEWMHVFERDYRFKFLDYRESDISKDPRYYFDEAHFNVFGAMKFTDMLCKELQSSPEL